MNPGTYSPAPMVSATLAPDYQIRVREACGIAHERQVLGVPMPAGDSTLLLLNDHATRRVFPVQRSRAEPERGFLFLEIAPGENLELGGATPGELPGDRVPVSLTRGENVYEVSNGRMMVTLAASGVAETGQLSIPGPVRGVRLLPGGQKRGTTFFDTRRSVREWKVDSIEDGPLRVMLRYRAYFGDFPIPSYEATFTLDSGSDFVRVAERWESNSHGDQIVWDFSGEDLPAEILRLDSTAGCAVEPLHYFFDHRVCRLFAWNQQSQLSDLADGYALSFTGGDALGFVTLDGGDWRGSRLNHLEAWSRRWVNDESDSRRRVPASAKQDTVPSPERIPARGASRTTPHLNLEGWIGESGSRSWALVAARTADLLPGAGASSGVALDRGCSPERRHFELSPDRARDNRESSRLRRIHTQHGLLPLAALAETVFQWPQSVGISRFSYPDPVIEEQMRYRDREAPTNETSREREGRRKTQMLESLAARVYGFWEGGASAATNPVVSRDIAPRMLQYEFLARNGLLNGDEDAVARAWFVFLIRLFESDNYYPGMSTMLPADHSDSVEPTLEGMANQNFYTDVVNIPGMGAQVFPNHPNAPAWRLRFGKHWARQLAYHVYPASGVWEESHTYFQHVLHTVLPTLLRRRDDGHGDFFSDPSLLRVLEGAVRQITPRDERFSGKRYLAPFGDHSASHQSFYKLYKPLAEAVAPYNPVLAARLIWMYGEMGGSESGSVTPEAAPIAPAYIEGLGYFLRGKDNEDREFLLALRAGSAWGHHHHDEGSIQFWAGGLSLIVDAGFGEWAAGKRKFNDSGHSRWALTDYPSMNFTYRFNRGWILSHDDKDAFPYAVAHAPVYLQNPAPGTTVALPGQAVVTHRRAVARIGPCAFLVIDVAETAFAQTVRFHVPEADITPVDGGVAVQHADGCRFTLRSILSGQTPLSVSGSDPLQDGKTTIQISAPVIPAVGKSRAAYLLVVDSSGELPLPLVTSVDADTVMLSGQDFAVQLNFDSDDGLNLRDFSSGAEQTISMSGPASFLS